MKSNSATQSFLSPKDRLLVQLSQHVDRAMLQEIAAADYGSDTDTHFAQLVAIHATAKIPSPLPWVPKEVLELMRWSEPEDPAWRPGGQGQRGHVMRAWCCAVLLRAGSDPESQPYFLGHADTVVNLIRSLPHLAFETSGAAADLLLALLESEHDDPPLSAEHVLIETGLIWLLCAVEVPQKAKIVAALDRVSKGASSEEGSVEHKALVLRNFANACIRHESWCALAIQLRDQDFAHLGHALADRVKSHAERLVAVLEGVQKTPKNK
jgi:hypothetical protein